MAKIINEPSHTFNEYLLIPGLTTRESIPANISLKTPLVKFRKGETPALTMNIPMTSLVALLSVFTLAISMAAQGVLANIAGGLSILYSKPFVVGDFVSTSGVDGFVTEIGLFYTRLKTFDQKVVSVPNSTIASAIVTDFSTNPTRRVDLTISASYDDDVDQVMNALLEACKQQDKVLADPAPFVGVLEYGNSSIKYTVRAWCKGADYWDVYFGLQNGFAETFKANGIHMTYDHVNVHMIKED